MLSAWRQLSDDAVVEGARRLLARSFDDFGRPPLVHNHHGIIVRITSVDDVIKRALLEVADGGGVLDLRVISDQALKPAYDFGHFIAAYIVLNDALAEDRPLPRDGCARAFRDQFSSMPEILPQVVRAAEDDGQHAGIVPGLNNVYHDYLRAQGRRLELADQVTRETLSQIGDTPSMQVIYHDRSTDPANDEYDVVRIGSAKHTFAIFHLNRSGAQLATQPLCLVGDQRCASLYYWP